MKKVVIDPALHCKLFSGVEFIDDDGKTLGYFVTMEEYAQFQIAERHRFEIDRVVRPATGRDDQPHEIG